MRNQQNIFDNATFFQGYQLLRKNKFFFFKISKVF